MKTRLLSILITLTALVGGNVSVWGVDWEGGPVATNTDFYLYNVGLQKFLSHDGTLKSVPEDVWIFSSTSKGSITTTDNGTTYYIYVYKEYLGDREASVRTSTWENTTIAQSTVTTTTTAYKFQYTRTNLLDDGTAYFGANIDNSVVEPKKTNDNTSDWLLITPTQYKEKALYSYSLKIYNNIPNAGELSTCSYNSLASGQSQVVTLTEPNSNEGYSFKGWSMSITGENASKNTSITINSSSIDPSSPTVTYLYAIFEENPASTNHLRAVSYNVDGLPNGTPILDIEINDNSPQDAGTKLMGTKLKNLNADIIGVQEDFNYNDALCEGLDASTDGTKTYTSGTHSGSFSWDDVSGAKITTDGLNMFWKSDYTVDQESRTVWQTRYGNLITQSGFDENLEKGYRYYRMQVKDAENNPAYIDVYTLHGDADDTKNDIDARNSQLTQLATAIMGANSTRPKIIMGDFNARYNREQIESLFINTINNSGTFTIKDAWVETFRNGYGYDPEYPEYGSAALANDKIPYNTGDREIVDKIFYVNPKGEGCITLNLEGFRVATEFVYGENEGLDTDKRKDGAILGDHFPVVADFTITGARSVADINAQWIWKGETGGDGTDTQDDICYNNKSMDNTYFYIHNVAANTFIKDQGRSMTSNIKEAGLIQLYGSGDTHQLKHEKDEDGYIFWGSATSTSHLAPNRENCIYTVMGLDFDIKYQFTLHAFGDDYPNAYMIWYDSKIISIITGNDSYLILDGTSEGSTLDCSASQSESTQQANASAHWQFISEAQKNVYLKYVDAIQTASNLLKQITKYPNQYKFANDDIKTALETELNTTDKRWWYQPAVTDFIELVASISMSNLSISNKAVDALNPNPYGTFVAPYPVKLPTNVRAFKATADANSEIVNLEEEYTGIIPACTPVLVMTTDQTNGLPSITYYGSCETTVCEPQYTWSDNTLVYTGETQREDSKFEVTDHNKNYVFQNGDLKGSIIYQSLPAAENGESQYLLQKQNDKLAFYLCKPNGTYNIGRNRCWLVKGGTSSEESTGEDSGNAVKAFYFQIEDNPDGINAITNDNEAQDEIYDLSGRRVMDPQRGIYIKNGKKVFVGK